MRRTKTFEKTYKYFEPGTLITPTSNRCPLEYGKIYTVIECSEPMDCMDEAIVFVEGHQYGVRTEYLTEVEI